MQYPEQTGWRDVRGERLVQSQHSVVGLDPATFYGLFPFHFAIDAECRVVQAGDVLKRLMPGMEQAGAHICGFFEVSVPR